MKKKTLSLNKMTVANLSNAEIARIFGGTMNTICQCSTAPQSCDGCPPPDQTERGCSFLYCD